MLRGKERRKAKINANRNNDFSLMCKTEAIEGEGI